MASGQRWRTKYWFRIARHPVAFASAVRTRYQAGSALKFPGGWIGFRL